MFIVLPMTATYTPVSKFYEPSAAAQAPLRQAITAATRLPEAQAVAQLLPAASLSPDMAERTQAMALRLAGALRARKAGVGRAGLVQNLLQEYALSSQEGVALMCLAEALLRIPDAATRDALIRDKLAHGHWQAHLGRSPSLFVNAATWGLLLTGKLAATHSEAGLSAALGRLVSRGGEPLIRKAVDASLRLMGEQFVSGETITQALQNGAALERAGFSHSYDMLGEAALTAHDATRYLQAYESAIHAIGQAAAGRGIYAGPGISIKLSALHPRYCRAQQQRVQAELYPVLLGLCTLAQRYDIGLNIDAEEADRLELSLDLLERLALEPQLQAWNGLGFVVQAYQKRCPAVIAYVIDLARRARRRLMVRLVKGAYWDSEIKRAQVDGLADYPVYTRKTHTDAAYVACARQLLAAPDAVYPQFATHNAHTLAAVFEMADPAAWAPGQYEFQCLHGMGEPLYEQVVASTARGGLGRPCRIYAPVGTHETLLAYLVRRLLENGANTSFVHRIADASVPLPALVQDPVQHIQATALAEGALGLPHPAIPLPEALYRSANVGSAGAQRRNSAGCDLASETTLALLATHIAAAPQVVAGPLLATADGASTDMACAAPWAGAPSAVRNPARHADHAGTVCDATPHAVQAAVHAASAGAAAWAATPPATRAACLEDAAQRLQADTPRLLALLQREAGKTAANAVAEVREAVDFLRYYAAQVRDTFDNATHRPLGPVVCISPWNFPLAIFIGQVAAALAAGNTVLAKPAEQTPLIAAEAVRTLWAAGFPRHAVQLLPGPGAEVGAALVRDARVQGVLFTGSTEVARLLQTSLAQRVGARGAPVPLIAETGGQNAMVVDSSALAEQVVADVLASAFDSAGQRCSALRVLCVQQEAADRILDMLLGAMAQLQMGDPVQLATDVGPVIDAQAQAGIEAHIQAMRARGRRVHQVAAPQPPAGAAHGLHHGSFVLPTVIEIEHLGELLGEVFGPVLHFVRYHREDLDDLLAQIHATGYGLTLGLHTRINETIQRVLASAQVGNVYVNRNMVGAVVGVQPFGGEGLSGTGPKAGGPLYLGRLLQARPADFLLRALRWAGAPETTDAINAPGADGVPALACVLPGPTGERNTYSLVPRPWVACVADNPADRRVQASAVLAAGGRAVWTAAEPDAAMPGIAVPDALAPELQISLVLHHGDTASLLALQQRLAERPGPVLRLEHHAPGTALVAPECLWLERSLSINTAAAGGNAALMTIG